MRAVGCYAPEDQNSTTANTLFHVPRCRSHSRRRRRRRGGGAWMHMYVRRLAAPAVGCLYGSGAPGWGVEKIPRADPLPRKWGRRSRTTSVAAAAASQGGCGLVDARGGVADGKILRGEPRRGLRVCYTAGGGAWGDKALRRRRGPGQGRGRRRGGPHAAVATAAAEPVPRPVWHGRRAAGHHRRRSFRGRHVILRPRLVHLNWHTVSKCASCGAGAVDGPTDSAAGVATGGEGFGPSLATFLAGSASEGRLAEGTRRRLTS